MRTRNIHFLSLIFQYQINILLCTENGSPSAPQEQESLPGIVYSLLWYNLQRQVVFQILQTLTKEKSTNI